MKNRDKNRRKVASKKLKKPKQFALLPKLSDVFFGPKRGTHAKSHRPLDSRKPIHVCFRSKFAFGKRTMLGNNKLKVARLVESISKRFGVTILKFANVGNHIHLVVKLPGSTMIARRQYAKWIRLLTSRIAFEVGGTKKGRPFLDENGKRTKFWDAIPFTRVVHGKRGWDFVSRYVLKNQLEAGGMDASMAVLVAAELFESARIADLPTWRSSA